MGGLVARPPDGCGRMILPLRVPTRVCLPSDLRDNVSSGPERPDSAFAPAPRTRDIQDRHDAIDREEEVLPCIHRMVAGSAFTLQWFRGPGLTVEAFMVSGVGR